MLVWLDSQPFKDSALNTVCRYATLSYPKTMCQKLLNLPSLRPTLIFISNGRNQHYFRMSTQKNDFTTKYFLIIVFFHFGTTKDRIILLATSSFIENNKNVLIHNGFIMLGNFIYGMPFVVQG